MNRKSVPTKRSFGFFCLHCNRQTNRQLLGPVCATSPKRTPPHQPRNSGIAVAGSFVPYSGVRSVAPSVERFLRSALVTNRGDVVMGNKAARRAAFRKRGLQKVSMSC